MGRNFEKGESPGKLVVRKRVKRRFDCMLDEYAAILASQIQFEKEKTF